MRRWAQHVVCGLVLWSTQVVALPAQTVSIAYSFRKDESGGVALVEIDPSTGRMLADRVILDSPECREPTKVRRAGDGQSLVVANVAPDGPQLFVIPLTGDSPAHAVQLKATPDDLEVVGHLAIISGETDVLAAVDLRTRKTSDWDVDETLKPPANDPEDVYITRDQRYAVISFQKDGEKGKKRGNRLAVYQLPQLKLLADLPLERTRPDLHIEGNLTEQGPGPEIIYVSDRTDTLLVTLDLYGVVGLADWSQARQGRPLQWRMLSTSPQDTWGTAFPDRGCPLTLGNNEYFLVCNAGVEGGVALVGLKQKQIVWRRDTPSGLETPVYFPQLKRTYSVCSGKTKRRTEQAVEKTFAPQQSLYAFDFSSPAAVQTSPVEEIPLGAYTFQIAAVSQQPPRLLLAIGPTADGANRLLTYDPVARKVLDDQPASGTIGRFEAN